MPDYVSRAGQKLEHALQQFAIGVEGKIAADLGCSTGGFTDCLLHYGAIKVYSVDTGYGVLDWKLRKDPRVVVMERTNAMHVQLPQLVEIISIDVAWTRQRHILPSAKRLLADNGIILSLIKPHYEAAPSLLKKGILPESEIEGVCKSAQTDIEQLGLQVRGITTSPIKGAKGNTELIAWITK